MRNTFVAGVLAWIASLQLTADVTLPYLGVSLTVLVPIALGTYCAFAIAKDRIEPRSRMWGVAFACFIMGGAFTGIAQSMLAHFTGMTMTDALQAGMGATVAFCTRFFLPWLAELIETGKWVEYVPFLRKKDK